jgi:hypothetical protein
MLIARDRAALAFILDQDSKLFNASYSSSSRPAPTPRSRNRAVCHQSFAAGVDDDTWNYYLACGGYLRWFRT